MHGSIDPWSAMGRTEPWPNQDVDVIIVDGASHCQDTQLGVEDNWPEMKLAKSKIRQKLQKWTDLFKVTVTGYKLQLHFEKCNRLQLHEVTFRKNVTGYSYMKLLFKKM